MKRILVTGASGFIGQFALPLLLEKGYEVHAVTSKTLKFNDERYIWHPTDLLDAKQSNDLIERVSPSHLLHFAWYAEHKKFWTSLENLKWVRASLHLMEAFQRNGGRRAVFAETCAEYDWNSSVYSKISTSTNPATLYGTCKHSLQSIISSFSQETGLSTAWGRIFFLYGPEEQPERLASFVIQFLLQGKVTPCSHGAQVRDFLYVKDVASAFVAMLESDIEGPVNIGSGVPLLVRDFIEAICGKIGRSGLTRLGESPAPKNDPEKIVADVCLLFDKVNWSPKYYLNSGIDQTIQWWKEELGLSKN